MKLRKRLAACILTVLMVFTMTMSVLAADYELGSGTQIRSYPAGITVSDTISAADGYYLTMTVDGVEMEYVPGQAYNGEVVFTATPALGQIGTVNTGSASDYRHRTALYVGASGIINENSVLSALMLGSTGVFNESGVNDIAVHSTTPGFSSIIVENNGSATTKYYSIRNSLFNMLTNSDGSDVSDFTGYGAAVAGYGNVNLTIENTEVNTTGVAKVAFYTDGGADTLVKNSIFSVLGGTLYDGYANNAAFSDMVAPPWVLGISGNARGTNLLGEDSTSSFVDSDFEVAGWGVLSVDAGQRGVINVINSKLKTLSNTGYGIYAIGNSVENFYGTEFEVGTYPVILTGGKLLFSSSEGIESYDVVNGAGETVYNDVTSEREDGATTVTSQFGIMAHNGGMVTLEKGTVFNTKNAAFLIKDIKEGDIKIAVDDSELNVEDGVILQMIDNDDNIVGVNVEQSLATGIMPTFNTVFNEAAGFPTEAFSETNGAGVTASFTNVDLVGDMFNATGYLADARGLTVKLGENATLEGAITSSTAMHVQMEVGEDGYYYDYVTDADGNYVQATSFTEDEYYLLGHVVNQAYSNGQNSVAVELTDNASWTVTETSYLKSLSVGEDAEVIGEMTINGVRTPIAAGATYTGDIMLAAIADDVAVTPVTNTTTATNTTVSGPVKTGDASDSGLWIMLIAFAVVAAGATGYVKKRGTM